MLQTTITYSTSLLNTISADVINLLVDWLNERVQTYVFAEALYRLFCREEVELVTADVTYLSGGVAGRF